MQPRKILLLLSFVVLQQVQAQSSGIGGIPSLPGTPPPSSDPPPPPSSPPPPLPPSSTPTSTPTSDPTPPPSNPPPSPPPPSDTASIPTGQPSGSVNIITNFSIVSAPSSSAKPSASSAPSNEDDKTEGLGTGPIIGLSVAGGVAVLALIGFFVWKFTRKRGSAFDDNEAIKWPELNAHTQGDSHPLPVHNTGRAGFDTGSDGELSRVPSATTYTTNDYSSQHDPYAVPPLPHMNPNQPYRDDPTAAAGYYDPYRGPVPNTFHDAPEGQQWGPGGEAIAMTQMGGRMSPGPGMAYDGGRSGTPLGASGRASPGPHAAYGSGDPYGVNAGGDPYGAGRASPGPQNVYGGGRASPGPQGAYGRSSPGPQAAYDYGQR